MTEKSKKPLHHSPLYDYYREKGVKLIDFGGWALPVAFTKIQEEHDSVRQAVGIFETSHMGEIRILGEGAIDWLNHIITNDASQVKDGQAQYTAVTNDQGMTLDDLIYYKISDREILVTPNGANKDKILAWFKDHNARNQVTIQDESAATGLIPIQGPNALAVLEKLTDADLENLEHYHFIRDQEVAGISAVTISRTGYTGEDGFELYLPWDQTRKMWEALLEAGQDYGIRECGLGARDTLRLEAGMALYGNDLDETINPIEGGIGFAVKTGKAPDFPGKAALKAYKTQNHQRASRGFELEEKGIARQGYQVYDNDGKEIGQVTSGTKSPTFGISLGFMLVDKEAAPLGETVQIQVHKKRLPAKVVKKDWLRREK